MRALPLICLSCALLAGACADDDKKPSSPNPPLSPLPPAAVTDLRAIAVDSASITLAWTSPGDDGMSGTAAAYEVRFATEPGDPWSWMEVFPSNHASKPAGTRDTLVVDGLLPETRYQIRLRAVDGDSNWGDPSNAADTTTAALTRPNAAEDRHWWGGFGEPPRGLGLNGEVVGMVIHDGSLVVAGSFTQAGSVAANHVAR